METRIELFYLCFVIVPCMRHIYLTIIRIQKEPSTGKVVTQQIEIKTYNLR